MMHSIVSTLITQHWGIKKKLMLIQLMLNPLIGLILAILSIRGYLVSYGLYSISADIFGMSLTLAIYISCVKDRKDNSFKTCTFTYLVALNSMNFLFNIFTWAFDGQDSLWVFNMLANEALMISFVLMMVLFWQYVVEISGQENRRVIIMTFIIDSCALIYSLALLVNTFAKFFFTINKWGYWIRGRFFFICQIVLIIIMLAVAGVILSMKIDKQKKNSLISFILFPLIGSILQAFTDGIAVVSISFTCALIIIYGNVFKEQQRELVEQRLENALKENALLVANREKQRIESELKLAADIQRYSVPSSFPSFGNGTFTLYASMTPAKEVGGDFYDYFPVDANHIALVMADVSGKGIPAALYMMLSKSMIKNAVRQKIPPHEVLEMVNHQLCEGNHNIEMFVTCWLGIVDTRDGLLTAANAGHEYPLLYRKNEGFGLYKDKHGFVLGGMDNMKYRDYEFILSPGDTIFVYTDGVTEATDINERLLGTDKMIESLNKCGSTDPEKLIAGMTETITDFVGMADQFDDITMLAFRFEKTNDSTRQDAADRQQTKSSEVKTVSEIKKELSVEATLDNLSHVLEFIDDAASEQAVSPKSQIQLEVAVEEIYVNIAKYSYAPKVGPVFISAGFAEDGIFEIIFRDNGVPFNPLAREDPNVSAPISERSIGGLGIFMVKKNMDDINYEYSGGSNILTVRKKL